jgi:PTS system fructose-specific IIC component
LRGVIQELSQALQRANRVPDFASVYDAALKREQVVSTDMEAGMAFPHARLAGLKELSFALGRSDEQLAWGQKGIPSVRLVFLLAVPATDSAQYLPLISGLARLSREKALVEKLLAAPDEREMLELLQRIELRIKSAPKPLPAA